MAPCPSSCRLFTYFLICWLLVLSYPCGFSASWLLAWFLTHKLNPHSWLLSELPSHMDFTRFQPTPVILRFVVFFCMASRVALGCLISNQLWSNKGVQFFEQSGVGVVLTSSSSIWHNSHGISNHEVNFISNNSKRLQQRYFIIKEWQFFPVVELVMPL